MSGIVKHIKISSNIFFFIIVIIIVVFSDDTIYFGTNLDYRYINAKYAIIILLFLILLLVTLSKKIKLKKNGIYFAVAMSSFLVISSVLNYDIRFGYVYAVGLIFLSLLIVSFMSFQSFVYNYDKVMSILAVASLLGFGLYILFNFVLDYFPIMQNINYLNFHNLFLTLIPTDFYAGMVRNYGIFREPGIFQMYLILALVFQFFIFKKPKIKVCILYIITIITTFSTTGYFALFFVLGAYLLKRTTYNGEFDQKVLITLVICIIFVYLFFYTDLLFKEGYGSVFGKLTDSGRATTGARLASVIVNIKLWLSSPIWGVGLTNLHTQYLSLAQQIFGTHIPDNTNTLLVQFATYGAIYGTMWVYGVYRICRVIGDTNAEILFIFIIFNILFFGENITFSLIVFVMLFYGFTLSYKRRYFFNDIK